tara:strand:+ start:4220 stop:5518 length:1299 start_codon:yes stop_codon:yes gene_type:complete
MMPEVTSENELNDLLNEEGALAQAITSKMTDWWSTTGEAAQESFDEHVKDHAKALIASTASTNTKRLPYSTDKHNSRAAGAPLDGKFERMGDFLQSVYRANNGRGIDEGLMTVGDSGVIKAALAEGAGDTGGFLVPEEFRAELLSLSLEASIIRPLAFTVPMSSSTMRMPTIKDTSHASSVFGGVVAYWESEAATLTESEPTFSQMQLVAKKLTGYTVSSNELLADSAIGLEAVLLQLFPQAITFFEDEAFINGTGVGQPLGLLNAACKVTVAKESGQAADTILYENLNKMYSRMLPTSRSRGVWIANIDVMPQLAAMSLAVGTGGSAVWVAPGGAQGAFPMTMWGRPVIFTEHAQTLGDEGDIIFVDPSYYVIGDRQELSMASSPHVKFTTDETVWRFVERLDGRPWLESALTPAHGTNTLSPIVTLAARA